MSEMQNDIYLKMTPVFWNEEIFEKYSQKASGIWEAAKNELLYCTLFTVTNRERGLSIWTEREQIEFGLFWYLSAAWRPWSLLETLIQTSASYCQVTLSNNFWVILY